MPVPTPTPSWYDFLSTQDPVIIGLVQITRALAVFLLALVLARFSRYWIVRLFSRKGRNLNLATLFANLAQVGIVALGVLYAFRSFGVDWAGLLTVFGAAGLAISLSMQDLLKNVVAGIYILVEQPFKIGDRISVKEVTGEVQGIELRTTLLWTEDQLQVVVPNNTILNEILTNRSASDLQRQTIVLTLEKCDLTDDSEKITQVLRGFSEVAGAPAPAVALEEALKTTSRLRVQFWVPASKRLHVTAEVVEGLQAAFPGAQVQVV